MMVERNDVPAGPLHGRWAEHLVPWGTINIAVTDRGIVAIDIQPLDVDAWVAHTARRINGNLGQVDPKDEASIMPDGQRRLLLEARRQIDQYFAGYRYDYSVDVDLRGVSRWDRQVLEATRKIRFGKVTSYGRLARTMGSAGSARAVGGALRRNPVPIIIPCHRVLAGDGTLGGYAGVMAPPRPDPRSDDPDAPAIEAVEDPILAIKRTLLTVEGIELPHAFGLQALARAADPRGVEPRGTADAAMRKATPPA